MKGKEEMTDPYRVLEVSREATDQEIKKAYRNKSRKYHPDSYADESQKKWAEEKFREVQEAYNQIVDERSGKTTTNYGGGQSYSQEDQHMAAAANYIRARKFNEAINVLNTISNRNGMWYYMSSYANLGLGNANVALDYAKRAVELEPNNMQFRQYYQQLQQGGGYASFGGFYDQPFGGGYGGGPGGYEGYGSYGRTTACGTGSLCCDLLCLNAMCGCC